jgi:hypothetical protein
MSLVATLLGVPGMLKKLQVSNAAKTPIVASPAVISEALDDSSALSSASNRFRPVVFSHALEDLAGQNNASEVTTEVANMTGPGVVNGVWLMTRSPSSVAGSVLFRYGVQILVDGEDVLPAGWRHEGTMSQRYVGISSPLGGAALVANFNATANASAIEPHFACAPFKVEFRTSLVVNLVHYETEGTSQVRTYCWVNAWNIR